MIVVAAVVIVLGFSVLIPYVLDALADVIICCVSDVGVDAGLVAVDAAHTVSGIDPDDPANITVLRAFEYTQAAPQSFLLNIVASQNM